MRSTFFASVAMAFLAASALAHSPAGHGNGNKRHLAAAPPRSRHAARTHRAERAPEAASTVTPSTTKQSKLKTKKSTLKSRSKRGTCKSPKPKPSQSQDSNAGQTIGDITPDQSDSNDLSAGADGASEFLKYDRIFAGFLPDDGSGGGSKMSMADINKLLPAKSAFYGRYAQVTQGKTFDGSQIRSVMDDVVASGGVLAASIMPYKTWDGLTDKDNRNAVAIAKFCAEMAKEHGVEVWLRFAHEMNWYQQDGTYSGGIEDFQTGWRVLSAAIEEHAPDTKMWWSPNVGSMDAYKKYYPKSGRVDLVGFDFYPKNSGDMKFLEHAKAFHDEFTTDSIQMIQGETGLQYHASDEDKMEWVRQLSCKETQDALPNYIGWQWFNYQKYENGKDLNFKIVEPKSGPSDGINGRFLSYKAN